MECMAAGLPMIASYVGALPETVEGAGVLLVDLAHDNLNTVGLAFDEFMFNR